MSDPFFIPSSTATKQGQLPTIMDRHEALMRISPEYRARYAMMIRDGEIADALARKDNAKRDPLSALIIGAEEDKMPIGRSIGQALKFLAGDNTAEAIIGLGVGAGLGKIAGPIYREVVRPQDFTKMRTAIGRVMSAGVDPSGVWAQFPEENFLKRLAKDLPANVPTRQHILMRESFDLPAINASGKILPPEAKAYMISGKNQSYFPMREVGEKQWRIPQRYAKNILDRPNELMMHENNVDDFSFNEEATDALRQMLEGKTWGEAFGGKVKDHVSSGNENALNELNSFINTLRYDDLGRVQIDKVYPSVSGKPGSVDLDIIDKWELKPYPGQMKQHFNEMVGRIGDKTNDVDIYRRVDESAATKFLSTLAREFIGRYEAPVTTRGSVRGVNIRGLLDKYKMPSMWNDKAIRDYTNISEDSGIHLADPSYDPFELPF